MPDSTETPPTRPNIWALAHQTALQLFVTPQQAAGTFQRTDGTQERVLRSGLWQWSVKRRGAVVEFGHSCETPGIAYEQAISTLTKLAIESANPDEEILTQDSGGIIHGGGMIRGAGGFTGNLGSYTPYPGGFYSSAVASASTVELLYRLSARADGF